MATANQYLVKMIFFVQGVVAQETSKSYVNLQFCRENKLKNKTKIVK